MSGTSLYLTHFKQGPKRKQEESLTLQSFR